MSFEKLQDEYFNQENQPETSSDRREIEPINPDSKPVVINVYHGNLSKRSDRVSQTENGGSRSFIISQKTEPPDENKKKHAPKTPENIISKNSQRKVVETPTRETRNLMSNDRKDDRSTEPRKHHLYDAKSSKKGRVGTEVERMKLQAELKATEEIAKLKQSIIEKRLALELATIQNKAEYPSDPQCNSSHAELRALEDLMKKRQSIIETNLAQELRDIDFQSRGQSARCPSTPPSPQRMSPAPAPSSSPARCSNPFRTESTSSMLTNLRGLTMLDKKFASEKPFTVKPPPLNIFDDKFQDSRHKKIDWYQNYYTQQPDRNSMYPIPPEAQYGRGQSAWKSAMAKIKKKMRSKPPNPWEQ